MYTKNLLAGLVGIGVLTSCAPAFSDTVKSENIATTSVDPDGCVKSRITANRVTETRARKVTKYVLLQWSSIDDCNGQRITEGTGRLPASAMLGSFNDGYLSINFDGGVPNPNVQVAGDWPVNSIVITLTAEENGNVEEVSTSSNKRTTRVPAPTKTVRSSQKTTQISATITGGASFGDFPADQNASIVLFEETLPNQ